MFTVNWCCTARGRGGVGGGEAEREDTFKGLETGVKPCPVMRLLPDRK